MSLSKKTKHRSLSTTLSSAFCLGMAMTAMPDDAQAGCPSPKDPRVSFTANATTGQIYEVSGDPTAHYYPASQTKVVSLFLTARLISEGILSFEQEIELGPHNGASVDYAFRAYGNKQTVRSILEMTAASLNIGLEGIQIYVDKKMGRGYFVGRMNRLVREEFGATDTYFTNANGLPVTPNDRRAYTTAVDMARIMAHVLGRLPEFMKDNIGKNPIFASINHGNGNFTPLFHHTTSLIRNQDKLESEGHNPPDIAKTGTACTGRNLAAADVINGQIIVSVEAGMGIGVRDGIMQDNLDMAENYVVNGAPLNMRVVDAGSQHQPTGDNPVPISISASNPVVTAPPVVTRAGGGYPVIFPKVPSLPDIAKVLAPVIQ